MHFVNAAEVESVVATERRAGTANPLKQFLSRYFYFCMSLVFAGLVVWGFSRTVNDNLFHAALPRPLLLWIHGAAFSGWVLFFIAQSSLVRTHNVRVHRSLGWFGAALGTAMVVLGFTIANRHDPLRHLSASSGGGRAVSFDPVLRHDLFRRLPWPCHLLAD